MFHSGELVLINKYSCWCFCDLGIPLFRSVSATSPLDHENRELKKSNINVVTKANGLNEQSGATGNGLFDSPTLNGYVLQHRTSIVVVPPLASSNNPNSNSGGNPAISHSSSISTYSSALHVDTTRPFLSPPSVINTMASRASTLHSSHSLPLPPPPPQTQLTRQSSLGRSTYMPASPYVYVIQRGLHRCIFLKCNNNYSICFIICGLFFEIHTVRLRLPKV